jgi:uncharacterized protein (DUF2336 family)
MPDMAPPGDKLAYEAARSLAASPDIEVRRELAERIDLPPEILYFLATDDDVSVRAAVAANPACPAKGNLLLADDGDTAVRWSLAGKIGRMAKPGMGANTERVLDHLTRDRVVQVRAIIADAIKYVTELDPALIRRLAQDAEIIVAAPILESSPVLTNQDLLDIIAGQPVRGALSAISRRAYIDPAVASAIVESADSQAIMHLLKNSSAHLQESVLDRLIEQSVHEESWQEPLVYRPELNQRSVLRLAELVAVELLERILRRQDLPPEAVQAVAKVVSERLNENNDRVAPAAQSAALTIAQRYEARMERARRGHANGQLEEIALMAMLLTDQTEDLMASLAVRADLPISVVLDIKASQSPRALCALAWAAGLSALFAEEIQIRLAGLPLDRVQRAAADGRYAVKETELRWQLAMFDGEASAS